MSQDPWVSSSSLFFTPKMRRRYPIFDNRTLLYVAHRQIGNRKKDWRFLSFFTQYFIFFQGWAGISQHYPKIMWEVILFFFLQSFWKSLKIFRVTSFLVRCSLEAGKELNHPLYLQNYTFILSSLAKLKYALHFFPHFLTIRAIIIIKWCGGGGVSFCFRKIHYNNYSHSETRV